MRLQRRKTHCKLKYQFLSIKKRTRKTRQRKQKTEIFKYDLNLEFALSFKKKIKHDLRGSIEMLGDGESQHGSSWGKWQGVATGKNNISASGILN